MVNPQVHDRSDGSADQQAGVLAWFRVLMGLRNDLIKGLRGNDSIQVVATGRRTVAFTCGGGQGLFAIVTFGTPDQSQDNPWPGRPGGTAFKETFNSSWPALQVKSEPEHTNGGDDARISRHQDFKLAYVGAVVLECRQAL